MAKILLEMKNITKTFPGVKALDNVNLQVEEGEIPVYKLAQHVNGEIPVEEVPNLMYVKAYQPDFLWHQ